MPKQPLKICKHPGCNTPTRRKPPLCSKHISDINKSSKAYDIRRGTPTQRGYDYQWQKLRARKLKADPYCQCIRCVMDGVVRVADMVHHILPVAKSPQARLDWDNLQSMHHECHEIEEGRKNPISHTSPYHTTPMRSGGSCE